MANRIEKLSDAASGERAEWIVPKPLCTKESLFDDDVLLDGLEEVGGAVDEPWFLDDRIGRWGEFRQSLTGKDLDDIGN